MKTMGRIHLGGIKKMILVLSLTMLALLAAAVFLGYHGQRSFTDGALTLPPVGSVVSNAHRLAGAPYDPLMGRHETIGDMMGFIVCSDVPNLAYGLSGYSLQAMLERDFKQHPTAYDTTNGNVPGNPYFHRRARNLYAFFRANGRLVPPEARPAPGDLVFYRGSAKRYVSHVTLVTAVEGASYRVMESTPETVFAQEVSGASPIERGLEVVGFGRMYQDR
jgi:hypothetical protein